VDGSAEGQKLPSGLADPVVIGKIVAPHGVWGTLKVKAPGSGRHLRKGVEPLVNGERRRILVVRETPKGFLVNLEGIGDRILAGSLRGIELLLDREELDTLDEEEFYIGDLLGLDVYDAAGTRVGNVVNIFETPAHEVLVIRDNECVENYVPFTFEHVPSVDPERGCIVVSLIEGLSE
jgi:16S rRNA processing protein RimM